MRRFATKQQRAYLCIMQGSLCADCNCDLSKIEADHVVPWVHGGTTEIGNLQLLCPDCHKKKTQLDLYPAKVSKN